MATRLHQLRTLYQLALLPFLITACGETKLDYPQTRRVDQIDTYHGVQVSDPYRWLEELDSEETKAWVDAQNDLSKPYLDDIPAKERIKQRLSEIWNYELYGLPFKEGGKYFYRHNNGQQNQSVLMVASSAQAEPRVLIDPNNFREDATISLRRFTVSPTSTHIAYGVSDGGSDWTIWRVRNVDTGDDLSDELRDTKFTQVSWSQDGNGFFYSRYPKAANGKGDDSKAVSIYYHELATNQADDREIYAIPEHPRQNPYGSVTEDGRYLVIDVNDGFEANAVHIMDLRAGKAKTIPLFDEWDALYKVIGNDGPVLFVNTNKAAPRGRVVRVSLDKPASQYWRDIVPQAVETLQNATYVGGKVVARYLRDAKAEVKVFSASGEVVREVQLPGVGGAAGFEGHADDPETFFSFASFTAPPSVYRYNVATGKSTLFGKSVLAGVTADDYETTQVFYQSKDGTRIPMFIIHRKGLALNGQQPTLLYGYGGFNISLTPAFNVGRLAWAEMGGVIAIPNLRGGGEYGEAWHLAGTKLHKQNVFDDFIAAAEWLIANGYTSASKLAIQGASNGGLLVAACLTQRPDLFGAALPAVGVLDMLRYHLPSANARAWSSDYGLSENEEQFKALFAYSPYHNIKEGTCFPPTLITTADHDDRVVPWHSFKFAAALQHAQGCGNPILIRVETRAGHGAGTPRWMRIENQADMWAFLVKALKMNAG